MVSAEDAVGHHCLFAVELIVKNTFLELHSSEDDGQREGCSLRRTASDPCLGVAQEGSFADTPGGGTKAGYDLGSALSSPTASVPLSDSGDSLESSPAGAAARAGSVTLDLNDLLKLDCSEPPAGPGWPAKAKDAGLSLKQSVAPTPLNGKAKMFVSQAPRASTTVMLCNLPAAFTRDALVDWLDVMGFKCGYDFVYLPMSLKTMANVGYAFVNFTTAEQTQRAFRVLHGFSDWPVESSMVCYVKWGDTQGLQANVERYRNSPLMSDTVPDGFKPAIFAGGRPLLFPKPTRELGKVRGRRVAKDLASI